MKKEKTRNPKKFYIKWVMDIYREHKLYVFLLVFLTIFTTVVTTLYPLVFKHIVDSLVENLEKFTSGEITAQKALEEKNTLISILIIFGIAMILTNIYPYMRGKMNLILEITLRKKYFGHILNKSYRFFHKYRTGDIATRLSEDVSTHPPGIAWFLCSGIFRAFNSSCIIVFCLISMWLLNPMLTVLSIIPIPLMMFLFFKLESVVKDRFTKFRKSVSETNDYLESIYSGIKILKSFNSENYQKELFFNKLMKRKQIEVDVIAIEGLFRIYFEFLNYLGQVFVLLFGGIMVIQGNITLGTYIAFYSYLGMIVWPIIDIPNFFVMGTQACVTIDRLEEIKNFEKDYKDVPENRKDFKRFNNIGFENVNFEFKQSNNNKKDKFRLKNIDFNINSGEKVAIVGKIGSGKSTLLNLISGIYEKDSGDIKINDISIEDYDKDSYRKKIGYIEQLPLILSENVFTNIDFWRELQEDTIINSARTAQFYGEIQNLPQDFQTPLGQRGIGLSGGQKQRLSIARALSGNPDIIIMDDVTSALDAENEKSFWKELFEKKPDITSIIVTHRMSTAKQADRIIVLNNGEIEAQGTHEQLQKKSVTYKELIK
ncbi:MAG: ABC transporter ATP-binding protein [Candidatus Muiribacteriota bacterium]